MDSKASENIDCICSPSVSVTVFIHTWPMVEALLHAVCMRFTEQLNNNVFTREVQMRKMLSRSRCVKGLVKRSIKTNLWVKVHLKIKYIFFSSYPCCYLFIYIVLVCVTEFCRYYLEYNVSKWHLACGAQSTQNTCEKLKQQCLFQEIMIWLYKIIHRPCCSHRNYFLSNSPRRRKHASTNECRECSRV